MRILFISEELGAVELTLALQREGHDIKLYINKPELKKCYDGIVKKTRDWEKEISWVGQDGLIIFDDTGFGKHQDKLRKAGYRVVGGSKLGDKMEDNREFGQTILKENGIECLPSYNFKDPLDARDFILKHPDTLWVVKKNGGHISHYSYVTALPSQEDALGILEQYSQMGLRDINLQKKVSGVEIGIGRYFNGNDWLGPIEFNIEHKGLMPGELGPKTPEMGTLLWYDEDDANKLFQASLFKLKNYLRRANFRGDIDINFFVSEKQLYPLEFTARFGNPSTAIQMEIHQSPWGEFLGAVADGRSYKLAYKREYALGVTLAVPPFPYHVDFQAHSGSSVPVTFFPEVDEDQLRHFYFEEMKKTKEGRYEVSGAYGCVMHVCGAGQTIEKAIKQTYKNVSQVHVPNMFYRADIGKKFKEENFQKLKDWGWI